MTIVISMIKLIFTRMILLERGSEGDGERDGAKEGEATGEHEMYFVLYSHTSERRGRIVFPLFSAAAEALHNHKGLGCGSQGFGV